MKLLFDESLSPKLVGLLRDLFPESESVLRNGLARAGDHRILGYAAAHDFILVSTDSDFQRLLRQIHGANVVTAWSAPATRVPPSARALNHAYVTHPGVAESQGRTCKELAAML